MSYSTAGLRSDVRQWTIYDDEALGALMRGLEAYALHICGGPLTRHRHIAVRMIGTLMRRVASHRIEEMKTNDGAQRVVIGHLEKIFTWIAAGQSGRLAPEPTEALDEIYAAAFRLDSRARSAGVRGPGVHRVAVRGD